MDRTVSSNSSGDGQTRRAAGEILSRQHFRVSMPGSAQELSELVQTVRPDLILLDANTGGLELLGELKAASPASRDIPVILMAGDGMPEEVDRALALGVEDFVSMPLSAAILPLRVRHTIDRICLQRSSVSELALQPTEYHRHGAL